ncbi:MAG: hypothetical protein ACRELX_17790 [Longimicrobiales bacterium]
MASATSTPWHPENEVERLICSLAGVISARVVANPLGRLDEIHVLASPMLNPKQVVRNVESALSAGLGIVIDRRIVSVAQVRRDALEPIDADESPRTAASHAPPARAEAPASPAPHAEPAPRLVFVGYDTRQQANAETYCRVTIRGGRETFTGSGTGASTPHGRALAGARAVFAALSAARTSDDLGLEGATVVEAHGQNFVLVAAQALTGRESQPLTGVAPLRRSPEEAAILASLQATNRWTGPDE